ncbi:MAG TPA: hypothetical protein VIV40_11485 [Kofleriaceae bacterium]
MNLACPECGHRQASGDRCGSCDYDGILDLDNARHVELLRDIDRRRRDKRVDRVRVASVGFSMLIVFALWLVPGYWSVRGVYYPGLPLFADQFAFMILIALGMSKLLEKTAPPSRFPYLED